MIPCSHLVHAVLQTLVRAKTEDIYIGKGKYVKDDPKKYPSKDSFAGGWAGGETGLWEFRDEISVRCSGSPTARVAKHALTCACQSLHAQRT